MLTYTVALLQQQTIVKRVTPYSFRDEGETKRYLQVARAAGVIGRPPRGQRLAVVKVR